MGISLPIDAGALQFYSQRIDGSPYVNCLPYSLTMALRYCGYVCPPTFGMTLRKASGVAVKPGAGTGFSDMKKALNVLLPDAPALYTPLGVNDLLATLPSAAGTGSAMALQFYMPSLPAHLRRWVGTSWVGWHGMAIAGYKASLNGVADVVWLMDPMGKSSTGYAGEWASWWDLAPAVRRNSIAPTGTGKDEEHPLFSREGATYYSAAYAHNKDFATGRDTGGKGPYQTLLSGGDETAFKSWVTKKRVPFNVTAKTVDYDMRGYWHDVIKPGGVWAGGHFPDTYKTPYDTTFSQESQYATGGCPFYWDGNDLRDSRNGIYIFADAAVQNIRLHYGAAV